MVFALAPQHTSKRLRRRSKPSQNLPKTPPRRLLEASTTCQMAFCLAWERENIVKPMVFSYIFAVRRHAFKTHRTCPKLPQDATKTVPRRPQDASRRPEAAPKTLPRRLQTLPQRPEAPPRGPESDPRRPKTHPRRPKTPPRLFQDVPRHTQDASKTSRKCPKTLQDFPRTHPRHPQDGFRLASPLVPQPDPSKHFTLCTLLKFFVRSGSISTLPGAPP